jgi:hypothetical protein
LRTAWLHGCHAEGALLAGSDQPARTKRAQGGAAGAATRSNGPLDTRLCVEGPLCKPQRSGPFLFHQ